MHVESWDDESMVNVTGINNHRRVTDWPAIQWDYCGGTFSLRDMARKQLLAFDDRKPRDTQRLVASWACPVARWT